MQSVGQYLTERRSEFSRHLSIARMLEARIDDIVDDGAIQIEVRHINTLKSGLLIHLYNIVEAIATRTLTVVGKTVVEELPRQWNANILNEWIRATISADDEQISNGVFNRLVRVGTTLVTGQNLSPFVVKGAPGSWDDIFIKKVAERLGCTLKISKDVKRLAYERIYKNDSTAMVYLAKKRNELAHGETTFEEGAYDLTLDELSELANRILPFLEEVVMSFRLFLDQKEYLNREKKYEA